MSGINYSEKIPNNVNLSGDRTLQRALEHWQPNYLQWWRDMGPEGAQNFDVYLRTAVSVQPDGWAHFDYVKMPEYRWGIFLAPQDGERKIHFGEQLGREAWQEAPGEHRANLRRIIVTQGDTEPASVEQQRHLGLTAPSLYDLRNLFQVNVEEGRHLWAMVYLLHRYFGRDGREEADALLQRNSGDQDSPRILGAFNEKTPDWLAFYMFTYFTDRDGKFQLSALSESGFDPLARTTKFMLTEEAHHMFVGESGVSRVLQRTCQVMNELKTEDPATLRAAGVIDLPTIQRYLNFHYSVTIDLFGADQSSNAAIFYSSGLKGRYEEGKRSDDHQLKNDTYRVLEVADGKLREIEVPMLNALNEVLRDDFIRDSMAGVGRWNRVMEKSGVAFRLQVPHKAFNRKIGALAGIRVAPDGTVLSEDQWRANQDSWLPTEGDRAFVASLMGRVAEPGKFANWIAPPPIGINRQPIDFEYVRFN
ncbi:benzoyl-CoA 2,3-epoxidase subunit BoxB [Candidimonas nitroreducens]|uniref:Benzoyl-CoA 2,3-epoxidase subunit BoxB n=1 Tax=Candidimonas nitroreducens TaxID=683354 RepID=A0A225MPA4_9BURK|nr:benzoyl-CoA 2,3-epoxidase subunit BoxB [Candidimonas nitroreducens]OWT61820.1 benzoyl-CoA 2,3-epoxidase subunit BoxB [Candidimonas nitroreducens]